MVGYVVFSSNVRWNYFLCGEAPVDIDVYSSIDVYISLLVSMCVIWLCMNVVNLNL